MEQVIEDPSVQWWQSKMVWGGVVAIVGGVAGILTNSISLAEGITAIIGGLTTIAGRINNRPVKQGFGK